jgi:hypothetical protein
MVPSARLFALLACLALPAGASAHLLRTYARRAGVR